LICYPVSVYKYLNFKYRPAARSPLRSDVPPVNLTTGFAVEVTVPTSSCESPWMEKFWSEVNSKY